MAFHDLPAANETALNIMLGTLGASFGGVIGYWYTESMAKAGMTFEPVAKDDQNVRKLAAGRIDVFITDELVGWLLIKKLYPGSEAKFAMLDKPESVAPLHVLASKNSPHGAQFLEDFNDGLRKIRASGEYAKIVARYRMSGK